MVAQRRLKSNSGVIEEAENLAELKTELFYFDYWKKLVLKETCTFHFILEVQFQKCFS